MTSTPTSSTPSQTQTPISSGPPSSTATPPLMPKGPKQPAGEKKPYVLTPEQEAKKLARAQAKAAAPQAETDVTKRSKEQIAQGKFLKRDWISVGSDAGKGDEKRRVKIGSWNMLAQTLVRRELFPGSGQSSSRDQARSQTHADVSALPLSDVQTA